MLAKFLWVSFQSFEFFIQEQNERLPPWFSLHYAARLLRYRNAQYFKQQPHVVNRTGTFVIKRPGRAGLGVWAAAARPCRPHWAAVMNSYI